MKSVKFIVVLSVVQFFCLSDVRAAAQEKLLVQPNPVRRETLKSPVRNKRKRSDEAGVGNGASGQLAQQAASDPAGGDGVLLSSSRPSAQELWGAYLGIYSNGQ